MGKRKRRADLNKTSPPLDVMPCTSKLGSLSKEKSSHSGDCGALKPLSSLMDIMDSSSKLPNVHHSISNHHLSRSIFLRHPRNFYGRQYSRRKSAKNTGASTSHGKETPLHDEKLSFKLASHCNSGSGGRHTGSLKQAFSKPERIRSGSLAMDSVSTDVVKMVCGLCERLLRKKPYILGTTLSLSELSVVAVLVCGHVYHADCLEQRTSHEDRRDPPCPLCVGPPISHFDA